MAKRKASGRTAARKAPAKKREKGTPIEAPVTTAVEAAADAPDDDRQPDVAPPVTRGRKKKASRGTPKHWQVAEPGEVAPEPPAVHMAKCGACAAAVKFTRSASGTGIVVAERYGVEVDTTFGIGESGKPVCPNGHGEMSLADEGMSAAEAFTQAKAKVDAATQPALFDTAKPFNFEGAWMDVAHKSLEVTDLARVHKEDADRAKQSKKDLEEAESVLRKMITTYDARRVEKERREVAAENNPDERLCLRINALSLPCDVASMRALSAEDRAAVETWLLDAEAHADERERWMASIPVVLAPSDAPATPPAADQDLPEVPDDFGTVPLGDEAAATMAPGEVPDAGPVDEFDAADDPADDADVIQI